MSSPTEADISNILDAWVTETAGGRAPGHAAAVGRLADLAREAIRERDEAERLRAKFQVSIFSERERSRKLVEALRELAERWEDYSPQRDTSPSATALRSCAGRVRAALAEYEGGEP